MKKALIIIGVVILIAVVALVGYVGWFLRRVVTDRTVVRATLLPHQVSAIAIEVAVEGGPVTVTEISMERALQEAIDLGPPDGFRLEPLPLEDREKGDPQAVEYVAKYNREKIRYVGRRTVNPGLAERFSLPARRPTAAVGEIRLQHEKKVGVGGSIGFASVRLGPRT